MARVSMKDRAAGITPVAAPESSTPAEPAAAAAAPEHSDSKRPAAAAGMKHPPRISIEIDADLRRRFKNWANDNGTTIKDELLRHIEELVS
ncbi:hypothetical protein [Gryllotalpicola protaetiae]|uniref:Uncharacterized protein n=1 Tax=Gryllotalpicola protaetiae TaxID=2419771 RepID=A0A387BTX3_9MICO|nr:hypothetical protein [Gryllotalpicola protaetiae]AYG05534.1 hypothetical protein D7I44_17805 [Gryllotalpicola protaetiae]